MYFHRIGVADDSIRDRPFVIRHSSFVIRRTSSSGRWTDAFTLVELLVVIAIIGILVALLLPAIQAAREAGRRATCKNHLRQIALSCINFESSHKSFPSNGWSWRWMGDPDKGVGQRQPGGWIYQTTQYLEEGAVFNVGGGLPPAEKAKELKKQMAASIPVYNCPSRRPAVPLTARTPNGKYTDLDDNGAEKIPYNSEIPDGLAKTDYAVNAGAGFVPGTSPANPPPNGPPNAVTDCAPGPFPTCGGLEGDMNAIGATFRGISTRYVGAKIRQITDGTSKTALVGEKSMPPKLYELGYGDKLPHYTGNRGDNSSMYQGHDYDNARQIGENALPLQDSNELPDPGYERLFGSAHSGSFNMALCDGSVQTIDYEIDPIVWNGYGARDDGRSP
jgi:prepilin-type N-terminal cleavage/methylation domain-containing protein/prepilin-type processing-associated H-X9-DG protein